MGYSVPPKSIVGSIACAIGSVVNNILPAPGAGLAYRLYAISAGMNNAVAANVVQVDVQETTGPVIFERLGSLSLNGMPYVRVSFEFPGYQLTPNVGLTFNAVSTAATGAIIITVKYYIDSVS